MAESEHLTTEKFAVIAVVTPYTLGQRSDLYPSRHRAHGKGAGQGNPYSYSRADVAIWQAFKGTLRSVAEYEGAMAHERAARVEA